MTTINLLPWREDYLKIQNNIFFAIAGTCVAGCVVIMLLVNVAIQGMVKERMRDIRYIKSQISGIESQIEEIDNLQASKEKLLSRRETIQELQASRPFIVKMFKDIVRAVPSGVILTQIERKGNTLTILGNGESNARITKFIQNLDTFYWSTNASLSGSGIVRKDSSSGAGQNVQLVSELQFTISAIINP